MQSVTFNFRPDVPLDRQDRVLADVKSWTGVRHASRLKPGAKHPLLQRMAYASLGDDADVDDVIGRLSKLPEIESASRPPTRRLVKGPAAKKSRAS